LLTRFFVCGSPLWLVACASSPYPSVNDPMPPPDPKSLAQLPSEALPPGEPVVFASGTLQRAEVEKVVDAGLGRFLGFFALEPALAGGRFRGWSISGLRAPAAWRGVDLRPGDVVTRVNGMAIEREMEAFDAFQAVRSAPTLEISYLRQNQPRTLRFTIVGAPSPALPQAAPTAQNTPSAAPVQAP
jgi:hypothetical protein